jgi:hypothetical protein
MEAAQRAARLRLANGKAIAISRVDVRRWSHGWSFEHINRLVVGPLLPGGSHALQEVVHG